MCLAVLKTQKCDDALNKERLTKLKRSIVQLLYVNTKIFVYAAFISEYEILAATMKRSNRLSILFELSPMMMQSSTYVKTMQPLP